LYIGLFFVLPDDTWWIAVVVFLAGFAGTLFYNIHLKSDQTPALNHINQQILRAEEAGDQAILSPLLHPDFTIVRASGEKQDRQTFLDTVLANKNRGRTNNQLELRLYGDRAVFTCIVTTTENRDGTTNSGRFWNTRLFVREHGEWRCAAWQVMKICDT